MSLPRRWQHLTFPGKTANQFAYLQVDGRRAMGVRSGSAISMLRKTVSVEPAQLAGLRFSWKVPGLIAGADLGLREKEDSPVRLVLAFDGDRSRMTQREHMISELARTLTGEEMPYATLMYVWSNHHVPGTVLKNSRTKRIRKLVLETGPDGLNLWLDHENDVRCVAVVSRSRASTSRSALVERSVQKNSECTSLQPSGIVMPSRVRENCRLGDRLICHSLFTGSHRCALGRVRYGGGRRPPGKPIRCVW